MGLERKAGVENASTFTGAPDFPELEVADGFPYQLDSKAANTQIAQWWRQVVKMLIDENDSLRRRVADLEAKLK